MLHGNQAGCGPLYDTSIAASIAVFLPVPSLLLFREASRLHCHVGLHSSLEQWRDLNLMQWRARDMSGCTDALARFLSRLSGVEVLTFESKYVAGGPGGMPVLPYHFGTTNAWRDILSDSFAHTLCSSMPLGCCKNLRVLRLPRGAALSQRGFVTLARATPSLAELSASACNGVDIIVLDAVASWCPCMQILRVNRCKALRWNVNVFSRLLESCQRLDVLEMQVFGHACPTCDDMLRLILRHQRPRLRFRGANGPGRGTRLGFADLSPSLLESVSQMYAARENAAFSVDEFIDPEDAFDLWQDMYD